MRRVPGENRPVILPPNINDRTPMPGAGFGPGLEELQTGREFEAKLSGCGCLGITLLGLGGVGWAVNWAVNNPELLRLMVENWIR